jgi:hypothetical protein
MGIYFSDSVIPIPVSQEKDKYWILLFFKPQGLAKGNQ